MSKITYVKMVNKDKKIFADVHPNMVKDYTIGGYELVESPKKSGANSSGK